ncbi:protein-disulfide reductase DsbD domain-containing protein [Chelativorans sp. M5D2P16]|uniref:protein-disulfide reductase DsbD domain-containing protein n=1 Tax=Chelativorans sp. M5D2P16 TaxID=3095678 RepID=UPI002ACB00B3|nr:protein-disulfide reductase DsbD domain-containing protein [Chelativorans sp. M5D2P16]MDZ5698823.1 protein-disulfide reductase DsbD family protein [Chelativorans sp. M5D2P16]
MLRLPFILAVLALFSMPASAASTSWFKSEGGAVRLVTSGLSDTRGRLRGALEIRLNPGWKTYWRNPGASGIPPQIDLRQSSEIAGVEILYPAPERVEDDYATWAGYKKSVALPVVFSLGEPESAGIIEGSLFLGICETICIPFQAEFSFDAGANPYDPADAATVDAAFATLPKEAHAGFSVTNVSRRKGSIEFDTVLPPGTGKPALFIAAPEGAQIAMPELKAHEEGRATFSAEILTAPGVGAALDYTLVFGEDAVSGTLTLP